MSMSRIRAFYNVPAKRGMAIAYRGEPCVISGSTRYGGMYLYVRFQDGRRALIHPTWEVEYPDV